jgi:chromosome segregation ATPase
LKQKLKDNELAAAERLEQKTKVLQSSISRLEIEVKEVKEKSAGQVEEQTRSYETKIRDLESQRQERDNKIQELEAELKTLTASNTELRDTASSLRAEKEKLGNEVVHTKIILKETEEALARAKMGNLETKSAPALGGSELDHKKPAASITDEDGLLKKIEEVEVPLQSEIYKLQKTVESLEDQLKARPTQEAPLDPNAVKKAGTP